MIKKIQKTKREFSAGGVVYRKVKGEVKWLIGKHSGYHRWGFPKGLVEKGESLRQTALREVEEETGIKTRIVKKIPEPERYIYTMASTKIFKQVDYFLMEYRSGKIDDHDWEMEEVQWFSYDQVKEKLGFAGAKKILEKAKQLLKEEENQPKLL